MFNMKKLGLLLNCEDDKFEKFRVRIQTKITRKPFTNVKRITNMMDLIHSDSCDFKSFVTIVTWSTSSLSSTTILASVICTYWILENKAFSKFVGFLTRVEKQLEHPLKNLRSDRGGEYRSKKAEAYLKKHGIIAKITAPYSPQSDGIA